VRTLQSPIGWGLPSRANLSTSQARRRAAEDRALHRVAEQHEQPRGAQDVDLALDVGDALARLSDGHRVVVLLRYQLGLTAVEAAQTLDSTPAAVRALTHRALVALRAHLDFDAEDLRPEARRVP
jgi:DNA-directed RNA polymerase specialized sigma24 family protein